jgi:hypothetical protein
MHFKGPELDELPSLVFSVAVAWNFNGTVLSLDFDFGVLGFEQGPSIGARMPLLGCFVSYTPATKAVQEGARGASFGRQGNGGWSAGFYRVTLVPVHLVPDWQGSALGRQYQAWALFDDNIADKEDWNSRILACVVIRRVA